MWLWTVTKYCPGLSDVASQNKSIDNNMTKYCPGLSDVASQNKSIDNNSKAISTTMSTALVLSSEQQGCGCGQ
ncbi:hypothetical protein J6590_065713 [Homalodisca vitripennis]|nr:hypothetical protein J6590_065713 [Homalodisca vitripennis]